MYVLSDVAGPVQEGIFVGLRFLATPARYDGGTSSLFPVALAGRVLERLAREGG